MMVGMLPPTSKEMGMPRFILLREIGMPTSILLKEMGMPTSILLMEMGMLTSTSEEMDDARLHPLKRDGDAHLHLKKRWGCPPPSS